MKLKRVILVAWILLSAVSMAAAQAAESTPALEADSSTSTLPDEGAPSVQPPTNAPAHPDTASQSETDEPSCEFGGKCEITDLKTPASPAFALIGVSPENVSRPTTPKDLALSLYNAFGSGTVPTGFAIEVAPYWLISHPTLTFEDYRSALWQQLAFNASVSVATAAASDNADGTKRLDMGFGARTHIDFLRASDASETLRSAREQLKAVVGADALLGLLNDKRNRCGEEDELLVCKQTRARLRELKVDAVTDAAIADATNVYKKALEAKQKVVLEAAVAFASRSPSTKLDLAYQSSGAWLTLGWLRLGDSPIDVLGVARYLDVDLPAVHKNAQFADLGARLGASFERYRFGIHLEALHRFVLHMPQGGTIAASNRFAGTAEVRVSDGVYISASFGKDLSSERGTGGLFTIAGISFQASTKKTAAVPFTSGG